VADSLRLRSMNSFVGVAPRAERQDPTIAREIRRTPRDASTPDRGCMEGLLSLWLFTQCFYYPALPAWTLSIGISVTPDRFMFGIVILAFLIKRVAGKTLVKSISKLEYVMLVFAIVCTVSWAAFGADADQRKFRALTTLFTLCFQPFLAYSLARRLPWHRTAVTRLLYGVGAIGAYVSITGIFEHFHINALVFPKYILDPAVGTQFERARGPFAAAVVNGGALIVTFLSLVLIWTSNRKSFALFVIPIVCITIYFTDTRGVWLGFASTIVLLALTRSSMRKFAFAIVLCAVIVLVSGVLSKFSLYQASLFSRRDNTVSYRYANYETLLNMFSKNPLFGIGYGNFDKQWRAFFVENYKDVGAIDDGNNTTVLGILGEVGIVGFVLYAAILGSGLTICISAYRYMKGTAFDFERGFAITSFGVLQTFLIMGATTDMRYHEFFNVVAFSYLGIISSLHGAAAASANTKVPAVRTGVRAGVLPPQVRPTARAVRQRSATYSR